MRNFRAEREVKNDGKADPATRPFRHRPGLRKAASSELVDAIHLETTCLIVSDLDQLL